MPQQKSAKKRVKTGLRNQERNRAARSTLRTRLKQTEEAREKDAEDAVREHQSIVDRGVKGVDAIHHLAAAFRELDVADTYYEDVNIQGTVNVLEAAKKEGVKRFIYCSTCGVHGNVENPPAAYRVAG